jgi:uncharacterized protein (TIGR03118 family)
MRSTRTFLLGLIYVQLMPLVAVQAQTNSHKQTNLVSDTQGLAAHQDANLVNPWGIAFFPNQPFWISDNGSGFSTLYDQNGVSQGSFVVAAPNGSSNPGSPTGIIANVAMTGFLLNGQPSRFIFDNEDGTISAWNGNPKSTVMVDNSATPTLATGAVYKGLALVSNSTGSFLLATNFRSGRVEVYDTNFHLTQALGAGAFDDPAPPAVPAGSGSPGYAPFGIHVINNQVVVTYALQDALLHDPLHVAGAGFVDLFNSDGAMVRRITSDAHLNAPWGAVLSPMGFGSFAGKLLIGNFGDGTINAYDFATGNFVDQMKDSNGSVVTNASLWDMVFGGGGQSGDANTMYITAGLANEQHGLFAAITANATPPPAVADFNLSVNPPTMTIAAGQSASFLVTLGGLNGFNSAVTLMCSGQPVGSSCSFSPASVSPASGGTATTMLTIVTSALPYRPAGAMAKNASAGIFAALLPVPAFGFLGLVVAATGRNRRMAGKKWKHSLAATCGLILAMAFVFAASGCGGYMNNNGTGTQRGMATVVVTGTSGNLSHSASVTLNVK